MSKKKNKNNKNRKDKENGYKIKIEISDVVKSLQLSEKEIDNINTYMEQDINKSIQDSFSAILADQNMTIAQKLFLSYLRGSLHNPSSYVKKLDKFLDIDSAQEFADDFNSSENRERLIRATLNFASQIMGIGTDDIKYTLEKETNEDERNRLKNVLDNVIEDKNDFDVSIKEWETFIEEWKKKIKEDKDGERQNLKNLTIPNDPLYRSGYI
jgi:hypothetical protein